MKPTNKLISFNFIYTGLVAFIFAILSISNFFNMGRSGYNRTTLMIYGLGSAVSLGLTLLFGVYGVFNTIKRKADGSEIPFQSGHVSESSKYLFLSNSFLTKFIPHVLWLAVVVLLAVSGFKVWSDPNIYASTSGFATAGADSARESFGLFRALYDVAIMPGFTEDMASFGLSAFLVMVILLSVFIAFKITKKSFFRFNALWITLAILISCPIASIGFGFISGFTQAHESVAGQDINYMLSTAAFQTFNLYVMWFTGLFFPIGHIIHNAIFVSGYSFAYSIT